MGNTTFEPFYMELFICFFYYRQEWRWLTWMDSHVSPKIIPSSYHCHQHGRLEQSQVKQFSNTKYALSSELSVLQTPKSKRQSLWKKYVGLTQNYFLPSYIFICQDSIWKLFSYIWRICVTNLKLLVIPMICESAVVT